MQISIIKRSELNQEFRIDSEYYKPINLTSENLVRQKKFNVLGKVCSLIAGPFGSTVTTDNYVKNRDFRYIRGKDVLPFFIDNTDSVFISCNQYESLKQFHIQKLDLLVTVVGMNFGLSALVLDDDMPALFSCKSTLIRAKTLNPFYLATYLNCKYGYALVRRGQRGAAQPGINLFDLKTIPIPLFASDFEQQIEDVIVRAKQFIDESIKEYLQAEQILLAELNLVDWKPKHRLSFVKSFSTTKANGRFDAEYFQPMFEEIIGAIKQSKQFERLDDLVTIKKCVEPGSEAYQDAGIPFLRVSNLSKFGIKDGNQQYVSQELYKTLKQHQPKQSEILLSKDATPGIAYYLKRAPQPTIPSSGILRLKVKDESELCPEYLTLVLNSVVVQKQIERDAGGSIINHWLVDQVKNTLIPTLSKTKQTKIADIMNQSFDNRELSHQLLEIAKRGVEMAIEKDESSAGKWIKSEFNKLNIKI